MESLRPANTNNSDVPQCVEVVRRLGETVVSVEHVMGRDEPVIPWRMCVVAGALSFGIFAATFASALDTAQTNKGEFAAHIKANRPVHEFRPQLIAPWVQWGSLVALGAGVLSLGAAVAFRRESSDSATVALRDGRAIVLLDPEQKVNKGIVGGAFTSVQGGEIELGHGEWLRSESGPSSITVKWVPQPKRGILPQAWTVDARFASLALVTALAAVGGVTMLDVFQPGEDTIMANDFESSLRAVALSTSPFEEPLVGEGAGDSGEPSMDEGAGTTATMAEAGAAGTQGIKTATAETMRMSMKKESEQLSMSREQVRSVARHSGALGVLREQELFVNLNTTVDFVSGQDAVNAYGGYEGLVGDMVGEQTGSWGIDVVAMGLSGPYRVGDRWAMGTYMGSCEQGLPCRGEGYESGMYRGGPGRGFDGVPGGDGLLAKRTSKVPKEPKLGPITSTGGLDKAIIRRYVRQKRLRIQHCYERELIGAPNLAGTVTARFAIAGNGKVIGASAQGLESGDLESCVAEVLSSIAFPATNDGSLVQVSYPFTFQPAG